MKNKAGRFIKNLAIVIGIGMSFSVTTLGLTTSAMAQSSENNLASHPDVTPFFNQIGSGFKNVAWGSSGNSIGPKVYIADFSNLIYKQTHVSQECYAKGEEIKNFTIQNQKNSTTRQNLNIYCFKNDKLVTGITISPGREQKEDSEELLNALSHNQASRAPEQKDANGVLYTTWKLSNAHSPGNLFFTASYDPQHNISLNIVFNDALLKVYANDEERRILASSPNANK
jgi:hypothetical protein